MSTFDTVFENIERFGNEFDRNQEKLRIIAEYELNAYDIATQQALLDSRMDENLTYESTYSVVEEASANAKNKINKARLASENEAELYFNKLLNQIKIMNVDDPSSDFNTTIRAAQQACTKYPALSHQEVTYDDHAEEIRLLEKSRMEVNKSIAKAKRGAFTKQDNDRLKEKRDQLNKDIKKKKNVIKKVVTVPVALGALLAVVTYLNRHSKKSLLGNKGHLTDPLDPSSAKYLMDWEAYGRQLDKEIAAAKGRTAVSIRKGIVSAFRGTKRYTGESAYSENIIVDDIYTEEMDFTAESDRITLQDIIDDVMLEQSIALSPDDDVFDEETNDYESMIHGFESEFGFDEDQPTFTEEAELPMDMNDEKDDLLDLLDTFDDGDDLSDDGDIDFDYDDVDDTF